LYFEGPKRIAYPSEARLSGEASAALPLEGVLSPNNSEKDQAALA
jgi:hypothetical protein